MIPPRYDRLATIYARGGVSGRFDDPIRTGLPVILAIQSSLVPPTAGSERAERLASRVLVWDREYQMPNNAAVRVTHKLEGGIFEPRPEDPLWIVDTPTIEYPESFGRTMFGRADVAREDA